MRKQIVILCVILALALAGCGQNDGMPAAAPSEPAAVTAPQESTAAEIPETTAFPDETTPADTVPVQLETDPSLPDATERPGCIYCGANAPDVPITEEGVCQSCHAALQGNQYSYCVDCGSYIKDPCSFDPYHCTGCGSANGVDCSRCGRHVSGAESIRWMCMDCYWETVSCEAYCARCRTPLVEENASGRLCGRCYAFVSDSTNTCISCAQRFADWEVYGEMCFDCHYSSGMQNAEEETEGYFGTCQTCGKHYGDNEGFEGLCFVCQDLYGPKCSVCGTDCTYRGTIDGMCDSCWEKNQPQPCAQCGRDCLGTWIGSYYVCDTCAQKQPCALCGALYYIWDMFEGVCFDCDDPSGGMADMVYCVLCGNGPIHSTESGLCPNCEAGFVCCDLCGVYSEKEQYNGA